LQIPFGVQLLSLTEYLVLDFSPYPKNDYLVSPGGKSACKDKGRETDRIVLIAMLYILPLPFQGAKPRLLKSKFATCNNFHFLT
jgi:hypothetical protein